MNAQLQGLDILGDNDQNAIHEGEGRYAMDTKLFVTFKREPVLNDDKSAEAGRPIYDEDDFVTIVIPGNRNATFVSRVTNDVKRRFESKWKRYAAGLEQTQSGTPLEQWPQMSVSMVATLKAMNVYSVEQLAEMSDGDAQSIMGNFALRQRAKVFLEAAKGEAVNAKMEAQLEKRDEEINALKAQMQELINANAAAAKAGGEAKKVAKE